MTPDKTIRTSEGLMCMTFLSNGETFSAIEKAETYVRSLGFAIGSMCGDLPIGIKKGDFEISKWRNLSKEDIDTLDGKIVSNDFRNGDVEVWFIKNAPSVIFELADNN